MENILLYFTQVVLDPFFLLAVVDFDYKFTYIDIGYQGRISDDRIYNN